MKAASLLCLITLLLVPYADAQRFYIKVVEGYSFTSGVSAYTDADPNGFTSIQPSTDITISAGGITTIKSLSGSMGTGNKIGLAGGYKFTDHLAAELAFNYFTSNTITIGKFNSPLTSEAATCYFQGVDFSPTFVIRANNKRLDPYIRAGAIFGTGSSLWIDTFVDQPNGEGSGATLSLRAKTEVKSTFGAGMLGAAGMQIHLTDICGIFVEVEFKSFAIGSKRATLREYATTGYTNGIANTIQGQQLSDLPEYKKSFLFSDEFQQTTNGSVDLSQPRTLPSQKVNLSGVGINAGFVWRL